MQVPSAYFKKGMISIIYSIFSIILSIFIIISYIFFYFNIENKINLNSCKYILSFTIIGFIVGFIGIIIQDKFAWKINNKIRIFSLISSIVLLSASLIFVITIIVFIIYIMTTPWD